MESIENFVRFLSQVPELLRGVLRWTDKQELPRHECETVETHSLASVWLVGAMLAIERASGKQQLNEARILLAASLHDVGEGRIGDVAYMVKNDPRIRGILIQIEHESVAKEFEQFPPEIRKVFLDAYAVEGEAGKTLDGDFFNAVERLGYMLFAVPQVKKGRMEFQSVFERQHESLLKYSERFPSVRAFYEPYRKYVEMILSEPANAR